MFDHTKDNIEKVFQIVEEMDKEDTGREDVQEDKVARPSEERDALKDSLRSRFDSGKVTALITRAEQVYSQFTGMKAG